MVISDLMRTGPIVIAATSSAAEAAAVMAHERVGFLPVVDQGRLVGCLTDRDIVIRLVAVGGNPRAVPAGEIMSQPPIAISPEVDVDEAMRVMRVSGLRRLPVVAEGEIVGIATLTDLAAATTDSEEFESLYSELTDRPDCH